MLNRVDKTRKPVFKTKLSLPKVPVVIGSRTPSTQRATSACTQSFI